TERRDLNDLNRVHRYHSISMMDIYSDKSFEEIRWDSIQQKGLNNTNKTSISGQQGFGQTIYFGNQGTDIFGKQIDSGFSGKSSCSFGSTGTVFSGFGETKSFSGFGESTGFGDGTSGGFGTSSTIGGFKFSSDEKESGFSFGFSFDGKSFT